MLSKFIKPKNRIYPLFALLISTAVFFVGLFFVQQNWFLIYIGISLLALFIFGFYKAIIKVLLFIIPISISVTLLALIATSFEKAFQNGLRILLLGIASIISLSIEPIQLVRNLNQLNTPRILTLSLLIALRFISVITTEMHRIYIAMKTRCINNSFYNPRLVYRAFIIPLISRILSISDTLTCSLETRAFEMDSVQTAYKIIKIKKRDIYFILTFTGIISIACFFKI